MYEFKVTMTEKDVSDYNIFHAENAKSMRKIMFLMRFMFPIVALPLGIVMFDHLGAYFWTGLIIGSVIDYLYTPKMMRWSTNRRVKMMLKDDKNGDLFLEKTITIDNKGIKLDSLNTSVSYKWGSIVRIMESDCTFYIYVSSIQAIILPKLFVGNEEKINELRTYLYSSTRCDIN